MRPRMRTRRESLCHADDWLMTYADMITLLLCLFAIFLSISIAKKDVPKQAQVVTSVSPPAPAVDVLESDLPYRALFSTDHPADDAAPATPATKSETPAPENISRVAADTLPAQADATPIQPPATPVPPPRSVDKPTPPAAPEPKGDRITILEMSSTAFFDAGSATLSAAGEAILRDAAVKLKSDAFKDYGITVEGHTDDTPIHTVQFPSNWELSTARAAAVVHFFLDQGIPAQKLRAAGYADTFPKAPNRDAADNPIPENQARNRRVVIKLEKIEPAEQNPAAKSGEATTD